MFLSILLLLSHPTDKVAFSLLKLPPSLAETKRLVLPFTVYPHKFCWFQKGEWMNDWKNKYSYAGNTLTHTINTLIIINLEHSLHDSEFLKFLFKNPQTCRTQRPQGGGVWALQTLWAGSDFKGWITRIWLVSAELACTINEPSQIFPGGVSVSWLQGNDAACLQAKVLCYINQGKHIYIAKASWNSPWNFEQSNHSFQSFRIYFSKNKDTRRVIFFLLFPSNVSTAAKAYTPMLCPPQS